MTIVTAAREKGRKRPRALGERVLSLTGFHPDRTITHSPYGAQRRVTCAACGREFMAVRSTTPARGDTGSKRARRTAR